MPDYQCLIALSFGKPDLENCIYGTNEYECMATANATTVFRTGFENLYNGDIRVLITL